MRTGHGSRWYTETKTFYDGAPGIGLECARWFSSLEVCVVGADNFAVEVVPPVDPEVFHPCHQHLIMENGIHLHEGMTFEGLVEKGAWTSPIFLRHCRSSARRARQAIRLRSSSERGDWLLAPFDQGFATVRYRLRSPASGQSAFGPNSDVATELAMPEWVNS